MTIERQDITQDFYQGNNKEISITVVDENGDPFVLGADAQITYVIYNEKTEAIILRKSTEDDGITIPNPTENVFLIHISSSDTLNLASSTFRHMANVVKNGYEETVMTGKVNIYRSLAARAKKKTQSGYTKGKS